MEVRLPAEILRGGQAVRATLDSCSSALAARFWILARHIPHKRRNRSTKPVKTRFIMIPLALTLALPVAAASTPEKGDMAVSFNVGLANAFDSDFDKVEPVLTGTYEYYTSPRFSWRGLLGVTTFDANLPGDPSLDVTFVNANVVYNWEGGRIHPYVTGGVGFYDKSGSSNLPSLFDERVFGVNAGGGINWFLGSRWGLKFEGTLHGVSGESPNTIFIGTAGAMFWF
jgi:hypothetical protein